MIAQQNPNRQKQKSEIRQTVFYFHFFLLVLAIGINGTIYSGIPFLFYQPQLDCISESGERTQCTLQEACDSGNYKISKDQPYPQLYSISEYLSLFCDRSVLEVYILTAGTVGRFVTNILLTMFVIKKENKELFMNACTLIISIALCLLEWVSTTYMFMLSFFLWYFCFCCIYGIVFVYVTETFPKEYQNHGMALVNMAWPTISIIYIAFTYYYGHWKNTLIHFTGIPCLVIALINFIVFYSYKEEELEQKQSDEIRRKSSNSDLQINQRELSSNEKVESTPLMIDQNEKIPLYVSNDDPEKKLDNQQVGESKTESIQNDQLQLKSSETSELKENNSLYKYFPFMFYAKLRKNFYIWTLCCASIGVNYAGCYYFLNQLDGHLFLNSLFSTLFEVLASFIASYFVIVFKDSLRSIGFLIYLITGIAFLSCIFYYDPNQNIQSSEDEINYWALFVELLPIIIAKMSFDMAWVVLVTYQKHIMPLQFQQQQFSCTNLVHALSITCVPTYRYFCVKYEYNPFIGFGVICLFAAVSILFFEEINESDIFQKEQLEQQSQLEKQENQEQKNQSSEEIPQMTDSKTQ